MSTESGKPILATRIDGDVVKFIRPFLAKCDPRLEIAELVERMLIELMREAPEAVRQVAAEQRFDLPWWLPTGPRKRLSYGLSAPISQKPTRKTKI